MINKEDFKDIRERLKEFEIKREKTIRNSRDIIQLSKRIIYSIHRGELNEDLVNEIKEKIKLLDETKSYDTGISNTAFQEYVEAVCYFEFVKNNILPSFKMLNVSVDNYLLGLCDLTGELVRKTVADAIKGNKEEVFKIKEFVEELYSEFLNFDLRNGELRKKADSIKWNLKKLEDLVLSLKLRG